MRIVLLNENVPVRGHFHSRRFCTQDAEYKFSNTRPGTVGRYPFLKILFVRYIHLTTFIT